LRIATIIGARPQFIKAAPISIRINNKIDSLSEIIIHTGQHFEKNMSSIFFDEMQIPKPSYNLNINQMEYAQMLESMVEGIKPLLQLEKVNGVLVYGDTNSTLAASIAAKQSDIPLFHVEAGLRSHDRSMFEENNRIITDHLSDLLFCPNKNAVDNLSRENITEGVFFSGDIMLDAYIKYNSLRNKLEQNQINSKFVLATIHRRENIYSKEKLSLIFTNLDKINREIKIILPLHPHTKKMINEFKIKSDIKFVKPLGYLTMLSLLKKSTMVITDSGGLQKESFFAKKKCLVIRKQTEWIELIENKTNLLSSPKNLYNFYKKLLLQECDFSTNPYGNGNAAEIVLQKILKFFK